MFHAIPYEPTSRGTQAEMGKHLNADGGKWEKKKREKEKNKLQDSCNRAAHRV